jgi:hypothetical protein
MNDNRSVCIAIVLTTMTLLANSEAISSRDQSGVSMLEEGVRLHAAGTARVCPAEIKAVDDSDER